MTIKNQARAVVIGGGVVGASILYHLTKYKRVRGFCVIRKNRINSRLNLACGGFIAII